MWNISANFQFDWIKDGEMTAFSKQALFSTFYTQQKKDDAIVTSFSIWSGFSLSQNIHLIPKYFCTNLSSLTLKTKELSWGVEDTPFPPVLHQPKRPGANRVNLASHRCCAISGNVTYWSCGEPESRIQTTKTRGLGKRHVSAKMIALFI